jgi:hypothetical protein
LEKESGGIMKRALGGLLGVILTGFSAYAQMRGGSAVGTTAGFGNGGVVERGAPASFHGGSSSRVNVSMQRNMGNPRGIGQPGIVGDRGLGDRRVFVSRGGFGDRRVFRGELFGRGFAHGHGVVIFAYGVPCYYNPDYGSYDSAPYYATDSSTEYTTDPDTQTEQYANQGADSYYQRGSQWGGELKLYYVTMDQFVAYLKSYILSASPVR